MNTAATFIRPSSSEWIWGLWGVLSRSRFLAILKAVRRGRRLTVWSFLGDGTADQNWRDAIALLQGNFSRLLEQHPPRA